MPEECRRPNCHKEARYRLACLTPGPVHTLNVCGHHATGQGIKALFAGQRVELIKL